MKRWLLILVLSLPAAAQVTGFSGIG